MRVKINEVFGEIDSLPGCSQVGVSHAVYLPPDKRGQGLGAEANKQRLIYMREELGYDYAICTVDLANTAQIHVLTANNWLTLGTFRSSKTGHFVGIFGKPLGENVPTRT